MFKIVSPIIAISMLSLTACASIVQNNVEKVNINTVGSQTASCEVKNGRGSLNLSAPSVAGVQRSKTDLDINCTDLQSGMTGKKIVESDFEPWVLGNILLGGVIGLGIDLGTGSAWKYPSQIDVNMQAAPAAMVQSAVPAAIVK